MEKLEQYHLSAYLAALRELESITDSRERIDFGALLEIATALSESIGDGQG